MRARGIGNVIAQGGGWVQGSPASLSETNGKEAGERGEGEGDVTFERAQMHVDVWLGV